MRRLNEYLMVEERQGEKVILCRCGEVLCPGGENYKRFVLLQEGDVTLAGPQVNPYRVGTGQFVFRKFYCPGCLTLLDTEVAQKGEPLLFDVQLLDV